jgi:hypothetical protein
MRDVVSVVVDDVPPILDDVPSSRDVVSKERKHGGRLANSTRLLATWRCAPDPAMVVRGQVRPRKHAYSPTGSWVFSAWLMRRGQEVDWQ